MAKENVNQTEIKLDKSDTMGPWQIAWNKFRQNKIAMADRSCRDFRTDHKRC